MGHVNLNGGNIHIFRASHLTRIWYHRHFGKMIRSGVGAHTEEPKFCENRVVISSYHVTLSIQ
jgi:hypothetical protein